MSQHQEFRGRFIRIPRSNILYSEFCLETSSSSENNSCTHIVIDEETGIQGEWSVFQVREHLIKKGVKVPKHFENVQGIN